MRGASSFANKRAKEKHMFTAAAAAIVLLGVIFRSQIINFVFSNTPIERHGERLSRRLRKKTFYSQRYDEFGRWIDASNGVQFAAKWSYWGYSLKVRVADPLGNYI